MVKTDIGESCELDLRHHGHHSIEDIYKRQCLNKVASIFKEPHYPVPSEHSKRVYQGVRVKHTVKDLLAEKRSRQTNVSFKYNARHEAKFNTDSQKEIFEQMTKSLVKETGTNSCQPLSYVQMSGSHVMPSFYGVRRSYLSDYDLPHCHSSKQCSSDVYSSSMGNKSFGCDPPAVSGYQHLFDPYIMETFGDYRSPAFPSGTNSIFTPQPFTPLVSPFPNESSHFLLRDSWDSVQENVSQGDTICDTLQQMQAAPHQSQHHSNHSLPDPDSASPSQYKSIARNSSDPGQSSQPYTLHPLEEMHFASGYSATSAAYGCAPFMTVPSELAAKATHLSSEEPADTTATSMLDMSSWAKEDASVSWPLYEVRRAY